MSERKWRVFRSRDTWTGGYGRMWTATSPWRSTDDGKYIQCDIRQCATWREAFDHADEMARA